MSKEPVGSVAEEAAKLFAVLQQAAADARGADHADARDAHHADQPAESPADADEPAGPAPGVQDEPTGGVQDDAADGCEHGTARSGGPECQWCPVCQLISRVRNTSPETIEHLSMAAAGLLGSVRSLLEAAAEAARQAKVDAEARISEQAAQQTAGEQAGDQPARSRVDRIDVSEDPEPWD